MLRLLEQQCAQDLSLPAPVDDQSESEADEEQWEGIGSQDDASEDESRLLVRERSLTDFLGRARFG
jgi:hypothetical protein